MRARHAALIVAATVSLVANCTPTPLHAAPMSADGYDYVVALSAGATRLQDAQLDGAAAVQRNLLDGIEPDALARALSTAPDAQPLLRDFDPAGVWLLHAADSCAAAAACIRRSRSRSIGRVRPSRNMITWSITAR